MFKNLVDLAQKTLDIGLGIVAFAADKAGEQIQHLRQQNQGLRSELIDELVKRGQMSREQAMAYVNTVITQAAAPPKSAQTEEVSSSSPRTIRIDDDDVESNKPTAIELSEGGQLRQQIQQMQAELEKLKKQSSGQSSGS